MVEAIVTDETLAAQVGEIAATVNPERVSEWSPMREGLARIEDAVTALMAIVVTIGGGKPPSVKASRRPDTAFRKIRRRKRQREHEDLVRKLIGR